MLIHFNCRLYSDIRGLHCDNRDNANVRDQRGESEKCVMASSIYGGGLARARESVSVVSFKNLGRYKLQTSKTRNFYKDHVCASRQHYPNTSKTKFVDQKVRLKIHFRDNFVCARARDIS